MDLYDLIVDLESLHFEVDTDSVLVSLLKTILNESYQKRRFSAVACADKHDFDQRRIRLPTRRKAVVGLVKFRAGRVVGDSLANGGPFTLCTDKWAPTEGVNVVACSIKNLTSV